MITFVKRFLALEAASGIILIIVALCALLAANSPLSSQYEALKGFSHWINDGLMVIFFFLIGMEVKREIKYGELSSRNKALLPFIAAIGGIIVPAIIFIGFNAGEETARGWAIASATDIAFSLGVLALLGNRVPPALKIFLMAVAVIDDIAAIIIIAIFYTSTISAEMLAAAAACVCILLVMNRRGVRNNYAYYVVGIALWLAMLHSGVHATVAGVLLGLALPASNAERVIHRLHPYVAFGIVPLFAFVNAGVPLAAVTIDSFNHPLTLGIALGLFVGKQMGVFLFSWLAVKIGLARLPQRVGWSGFYGVSVLTGIGFTMSLFIGELAFTDNENTTMIRLGVLSGSLLSALCGYVILRKVSWLRQT